MTTSDDTLNRRLARLNRLRKLGVRRGARDLPRPASAPAASAVERAASNLQSSPSNLQPSTPTLPGEPIETPHGPAWLRTVRYPLTEHPELAGWLAVKPEALAALDRNDALLDLDPRRAAFVDTETTGLSLGAGTHTFLIGVGTYELPAETNEGTRFLGETGFLKGAFVVRQFFMRTPAEEAAQIHLVAEALTRCTGVVSFNGRGFDMPLITNRFVLAGRPPPLLAAPHLDLLPPARRAWRARWGACNLGSLERNVLGLQRSADDVPGFLIPDIYRQYYQTGIVSENLVRVFYHNLQDIVSMALLAERLAAPFDPARQAETLAGLHPLECLSLGRCYDAVDWPEAAVTAYRRALAGAAETATQIESLRDLAALYKRLERRAEAAALWEAWISTAPGDDITPYIELAKHHEWRTGDLQAARGWAAWARHIVEAWPPGLNRDATLAEIQHRLARLETKLRETSR